MGDRKSSKKPVEHVKKFMKLTLRATEELKDEAYVQIMKQIKEHKDYERSIRGWNFFAILASCYAPTASLYYSILNYLFFEIQNNTDKNIVHHANYVFIRLYKSRDVVRKNYPSDNEIMHIEHMKPMIVPIHFFSGTSSLLEVESYTTIRELKTNLMKKLQFNINRAPYYCLFEICNKREQFEERYLEDSQRVSDILSLWDRDIEDFLKKKEQIEFKIYLKLFLYYPYADTDVDSVSIVFYQTVYDVVGGKYNLNENDIISLASLQLLVEFSTSQDSAYQNLQKNLDKYVPINKIGLNPTIQWVQKIMELYSTLNANSKLEAKLAYIEQLKNSPVWEAHQFDAKVI
jgi:myosin-7